VLAFQSFLGNSAVKPAETGLTALLAQDASLHGDDWAWACRHDGQTGRASTAAISFCCGAIKTFNQAAIAPLRRLVGGKLVQ